MATTVGAERITAAEFLHHPAAEGPSELVHGEVRVLSPAGGPHGLMALNVAFALRSYVAPRKLGRVFADRTGFALPPRDDTVRSPDAAFVRAGRLPAHTMPEGWVPVAPDLVVEILSPSERFADLMEKLDDYFAGGTAVAWVVDPRRRGVDVHLADRTVRWLGDGAVLDGGPALPEFRMAVADVFADALPDA
jgi:Uma2 family endonuclease